MRMKMSVLTVMMTFALLLVALAELRAQTRDLTGRQDLGVQEIERALLGHTIRGDTTAITRGVRPALAISVRFASGSARIPATAAHNLESLGKALQSPGLASSRFQITGHTDSAGHDCYNLHLSKNRAQSVKAYLVNNFEITPQRLIAGGLGEEDPIANNETPAGKEKNRRVEIMNVGTE